MADLVKSAAGVSRTRAMLVAAARLLGSVPGLPDAYVTCSGQSKHIGVQFSYLPADELFPAVARVAEWLGGSSEAAPVAGGEDWHFTARGVFEGFEMTVYAAASAVTDPALQEWEWDLLVAGSGRESEAGGAA